MAPSRSRSRRASSRLVSKPEPSDSMINGTLEHSPDNIGDNGPGNSLYNTSESSLSTCASLELKARIPPNKGPKRKVNSLNNDDYLVSESDSEDKPVSNDTICKRCDQLTCELTEMRIQNFDRWLSEIRTLEQMLFKKEAIIEDFKKQLGDAESELALLKKQEATLKRNNNKLTTQLANLKEKLRTKEEEIDQLEIDLKGKNDLIGQQKRAIDKLEKLAQEDCKLIKKLRSNA